MELIFCNFDDGILIGSQLGRDVLRKFNGGHPVV